MSDEGSALLSPSARAQAEVENLALHYDDSCVVCGAPVPDRAIGTVQEREYSNTTRVEFPVVQCATCGLTYLHPRPAESELGRIYPKEYYAYHLVSREAADIDRKPSAVERVLERRSAKALERRLSAMQVSAPEGRPLRVLDIGCGTGRHLDLMRLAFPGCETHGVDLGESAVEVARRRGHNVHLGRFERTELPTAYFDLVMSFHVIEHVARPDLFLERCRDLLVEGGRILIETPNTDCLDFRLLQGRHWGGYHPPRHWYLFQRRAFDHLARRLGLSIIGHALTQNAPFYAWTCHSLLRRAVGSKIADRVVPPVTILYGGLYSLALLAGLSLFEQLVLRLTGKASSMWIAFAADGQTPRSNR